MLTSMNASKLTYEELERKIKLLENENNKFKILISNLKLDENQTKPKDELKEKNEELIALFEEYETINEQLEESNQKLQRANQQLFESENQYKALFEQAPIAKAKVNLNYQFEKINKAFCRLVGLTEEEIIGKTIKDVTLPDDLPQNMRLQQKLRIGEIEKFVLEKRFIHKSGIITTGILTASLVRNENNEPAYFIGQVVDITEEIKAKNALKQSEALFRTTFDQAAVGIAHVRPNGQFSLLNDKFCEIVGYSNTELLQMNFRDITHPEDLGIDDKYIKKVFNNEIDTYKIEKRYIKNNGQVIWINLHSSVIRNETGEPQYAVAAISDITESKRLEREIKEREAILATVINNLPFEFWARDINEICFLQNKISEDRWGPFIDTKPEDLNISKAQLKIWKSNNKRVLAGETINEEIEVKEKDGKIRHINNIIAPIIDNNKTIGIFGLNIDITKQKKYENDLKKAIQKAEESDRLKTAFLCNMSHEIRTPMNGIIGFANMIDKPGLTDERRKYYAQIITQSSNQLLAIVNDILDISKIETGQLEYCETKVVLNSLLRDLYSMFVNSAHQKGISLLHKKGLPDNESIILTDELKLRQVLTNLINNAIKFTNEGNVIFGYRLTNDNLLEFFVEDTGIGIPESDQKFIFDRFRQVENETTRKYGGTGLGLSICKGYINFLGGNISVDSTHNQGSIFSFTLSYKKEDSFTDSYENQQEEQGYSAKILVAEDEDFNFLFIEEVLSEKQFKIFHVRDGAEAIEFCEQTTDIDLIIMDLKMPNMNGYEATEIIKKKQMIFQ